MSDSIAVTAEYNELLDSIKRTLAAGQLRAARAVNNILVETYWQIGLDIVARQRHEGWGRPGSRAPVRGPANGKPRHARTVGSQLALHDGTCDPVADRNCAMRRCTVALEPGGDPARQLPRPTDLRVLRQTRYCGGLDPGRPAVDDRQPTTQADPARAQQLRPGRPRSRPGRGAGDRQGPVQPRLPRRRPAPSSTATWSSN